LGGILGFFVIHDAFGSPRESTYILIRFGLSIIVTIKAAVVGYKIESREINKTSKSS
jgi:hypothetical protein